MSESDNTIKDDSKKGEDEERETGWFLVEPESAPRSRSRILNPNIKDTKDEGLKWIAKDNEIKK